MDPLFTNKTRFTKQNMVEIGKAAAPLLPLTIFFVSIGLILFIIGALTADYFSILLGAFFALIYPIFSRWSVRHTAVNRYQQLIQINQGEDEAINQFYDDHMDVHHIQNGAHNAVSYSQIARVYESKNLFFLMLSTSIGFMLEKQGFEGITADEFRWFIKARAVGEGQVAYKRKKRKTTFVMSAIVLIVLAVSVAFGFLGDAIMGMVPKTFSDGNYSIRLTGAFKDRDDEWSSSEATVYYFYDSKEDLKAAGSAFKTAEAYLLDTNLEYDIKSVIFPLSESRAWTAYKDSQDGHEYFYYDYVIMKDGDFWQTEFCCLAEDAERYQPLFEKWAQTIRIR